MFTVIPTVLIGFHWPSSAVRGKWRDMKIVIHQSQFSSQNCFAWTLLLLSVLPARLQTKESGLAGQFFSHIVMTLRNLISGYQCFGENCCFHRKDISTLKMEVAALFETSLPVHHTARRHFVLCCHFVCVLLQREACGQTGPSWRHRHCQNQPPSFSRAYQSSLCKQ